jgi:hypothetical protein
MLAKQLRAPCKCECPARRSSGRHKIIGGLSEREPATSGRTRVSRLPDRGKCPLHNCGSLGARTRSGNRPDPCRARTTQGQLKAEMLAPPTAMPPNSYRCDRGLFGGSRSYRRWRTAVPDLCKRWVFSADGDAVSVLLEHGERRQVAEVIWSVRGAAGRAVRQTKLRRSTIAVLRVDGVDRK